MAKILGARFNVYTVLGLLVIAAAMIFSLWKIIDFYLPDKAGKPITIEQLREINKERYDIEDSLNKLKDKQLFTIITILNSENKKKDSLLGVYYSTTQKKYDEKINSIDTYTNSDIMRAWSERYR